MEASVVVGAPQAFRLCALLLVSESPLDRPSARSGGTPSRRRGSQAFGEEISESPHRGLSVLELGSLFRRLHGEHAVNQSPIETAEDALPLYGTERGGRAQIQAEFDAGVGGVDRLPARP